jgi:DNA-binding MarR family transcriptional regulator
MMETDKTQLIAEIRRLQQQIPHVMGQYSPGVWMELDLTIAQLKSLFFIEFGGSSNLSQLATALGVTPPNVTGIIDRLVKQGLVNRKENPENRRMLVLQVTDKGKALLARLRESGLGRMSGILNQLSKKELTGLMQGLAAITRIAMSPQGER